MSILVTGASGLIGSHLCKRLVLEGYDVIGLVHDRVNPFTDSLAEHNNFKVHIGDIRDGTASWVAMSRYKIKSVFHIAAQLPYTSKKDLASVNIRGTINMLNSAHRNGVEEFIFASSMGVYSDPPSYLPVDELHPTQPSTVYGVTKLAAELSCKAYNELMRVVILRYAGAYGISSEKNRAVNNFIRSALSNQPLIVDGDGSQSSDFVYVDDIVQGTYLAWREQVLGVYNIGSGQDTTIKELAELIIECTNSKSEIVFNGDKVDRPFRFFLDISKAKKELGYSPCLLKDGLSSYIKEWNNG